jgi:hypothetical protein
MFYPLGVGMCHHGNVRDHFLVCRPIAVRDLNDTVQDQHSAVRSGFIDNKFLSTSEKKHNETHLKLRLLLMEHLVDLDAHSLTGPKRACLREPAVLQAVCHAVLWRK